MLLLLFVQFDQLIVVFKLVLNICLETGKHVEAKAEFVCVSFSIIKYEKVRGTQLVT